MLWMGIQYMGNVPLMLAGTAVAGWLLEFSGYVGGAPEQTASCINMLHVMYLRLPLFFNLLIAVILAKLDVEKANEKLRLQVKANGQKPDKEE